MQKIQLYHYRNKLHFNLLKYKKYYKWSCFTVLLIVLYFDQMQTWWLFSKTRKIFLTPWLRQRTTIHIVVSHTGMWRVPQRLLSRGVMSQRSVLFCHTVQPPRIIFWWNVSTVLKPLLSKSEPVHLCTARLNRVCCPKVNLCAPILLRKAARNRICFRLCKWLLM